MWPSSAPLPVAPRYGLPSRIRPPPTPVPSVSITTSRAPRAAPDPPLGDRGGVGVVVDRHRTGRAAPASGRGSRRPRAGCSPTRRARPAALVDPRRDAEAERLRVRLGPAQLLHQRRRAPRAARPARRRSRRTLEPRASIEPSRDDDRGEDLRPADVDPDDPRLLQNRRGYHTPPDVDARRREALPRLPRRARRRAGCRPSGGPRSRRRGRRPSATAAAATAGPGRRRPPAGRARSAGAASSTIALVLIVALLPRLERDRLPRLPQRRLGGEQAAAAERRGARSRPTRAACSRSRPRSCCSAPTTRSPPRGPATGTPTRSRCCAPTPRTTGSTTSRSRATCASRSPATAARRSTPPTRSAARGSPPARSRPTPTSRSTTSSSSTSPSSKT